MITRKSEVGRNRKKVTRRENKRNAGKDMTDDASKVYTPGDNGNADDNVSATDTASGTFKDSQFLTRMRQI